MLVIVTVKVSRDGTTQGQRGAMHPPTTPKKNKNKKNLWKKKKKNTSLYINKENLVVALKFIYLSSLPQKIYKLTQEIQQIDNKKNL